MASANTFAIELRGCGGHAALPDFTLGPVLSTTIVHVGEVTNGVPDACRIEGTVRAYSSAVADVIDSRLKTLSHQVAEAHGPGCEVVFLRRAPPVVNHPPEATFSAGAMAMVRVAGSRSSPGTHGP